MRMGQLLCKRMLPHGMIPGCRVDPALNFAREFNPAKAVSFALLIQEARPFAVRGIRDGCKNAHMFSLSREKYAANMNTISVTLQRRILKECTMMREDFRNYRADGELIQRVSLHSLKLCESMHGRPHPENVSSA